MKWPSLSLIIAFVLKSILFDISIATTVFFYVHLLGIFFPSFHSLCKSFVLRWVSCKQHILGHVYLPIQLLCAFWMEHLTHFHLRLFMAEARCRALPKADSTETSLGAQVWALWKLLSGEDILNSSKWLLPQICLTRGTGLAAALTGKPRPHFHIHPPSLTLTHSLTHTHLDYWIDLWFSCKTGVELGASRQSFWLLCSQFGTQFFNNRYFNIIFAIYSITARKFVDFFFIF